MSIKSLPSFLIICLLVMLFGGLFTPGEWYAELNRAPWSPPNIAFPIVWGILYLMIAISGWLIFDTEHQTLKVLWVTQLLLNAAWSWIFFGQHWVLVGLIEILAILGLVTFLIVKSFRAGLKLASLLLLPYLIWLVLATSLNAYIVLNN